MLLFGLNIKNLIATNLLDGSRLFEAFQLSLPAEGMEAYNKVLINGGIASSYNTQDFFDKLATRLLSISHVKPALYGINCSYVEEFSCGISTYKIDAFIDIGNNGYQKESFCIGVGGDDAFIC